MSQPHDAMPTGPVQTLRVRQVVGEAFRIFWAQRAYLPQAVATPLLLALLLTLLGVAYPGLSLLTVPLTLIPYALFAITWYRLNLLGPQIAPPRLAPSWSRYHTRFLGYFIGFTLVNLVLSTIYLAAVLHGGSGAQISLAAVLMVLAMVFGVFYFMARLCLVFPATAVGESYSLKESWRHTAGQGGRLVAAVFLTILPLAALFMIIGTMLRRVVGGDTAPAGSPEAAAALHDLVAWIQIGGLVFEFVFLAILITLISRVFLALTGWVPDHDNLPAVAGQDDENE